MSHTPTNTTVTIDTSTDAAMDTSVAALDESVRTRLLNALRHVDSVANTKNIRDTIRDVLAEEAPDRPAIGVVFTTMEFDNGYYLTDNGAVLFEDNTIEFVSFTDLDDVFADEYGCVGENFVLTVDLRTGQTDTDDYYSGSVHEAFGLPAPPKKKVEVSVDEQGLWHVTITFFVFFDPAALIQREAELTRDASSAVRKAMAERGITPPDRVRFDAPMVRIDDERVESIMFSQVPSV